MGDLTTHRPPDTGRLPDMERQQTRSRLEALPDIRPRDMDLPLLPHPARSDQRLRPHQRAGRQAARAASQNERRGAADCGEYCEAAGATKVATSLAQLPSLAWRSGRNSFSWASNQINEIDT